MAIVIGCNLVFRVYGFGRRSPQVSRLPRRSLGEGGCFAGILFFKVRFGETPKGRAGLAFTPETGALPGISRVDSPCHISTRSPPRANWFRAQREYFRPDL